MTHPDKPRSNAQPEALHGGTREVQPRASRPLSKLLPGQEARVIALQGTGAIRRRLLETGFIQGETVQVRKVAPLGDPMELMIKGYHLSLRRVESACIFVELGD